MQKFNQTEKLAMQQIFSKKEKVKFTTWCLWYGQQCLAGPVAYALCKHWEKIYKANPSFKNKDGFKIKGHK